MSYDVFFQGFKHGNPAAGGGDAVRAMLTPHVTESEREHSFLRIEVEDGAADVYLSDDHMMVNHAGGIATWDLLVRVAAAVNWTILLPDGPTALTDESQRPELPVELVDEAVMVTNGSSLLRLIESV